MIKTFEEARYLIRELKICTIFDSPKSALPSLWQHVDLPEKQEGEKGWDEKVSAVPGQKNQQAEKKVNEFIASLIWQYNERRALKTNRVVKALREAKTTPK